MSTLAPDLFDQKELTPLATRLGPQLRALADKGVYFGTSSWKYEGWVGSIYTKERYITRGKFSQKKFEAECLTEYAATFPAVCGDFTFYRFPTADTWKEVLCAAPSGMVFGLKVPETMTVAKWPGHARYGQRAGKLNEHFLDAALFETAFIRLLEPYRERVAVLIFEFGHFSKKDFPKTTDFFKRLDGFLGVLPTGWRYGVEIRNHEYLADDYFAVLRRHNVAHVFNAWTRMPTIAEQIAIPEAFTADFIVVRALTQTGASYEKTVEMFEPYDRVQQPDHSTRDALRRIAARALSARHQVYNFINNRLEGNSPGTIEAVTNGL